MCGYVDAHVTTVGTAYSLPIQLRASFKGELAVSSRSSLPPSIAEAPLLLLFSKPTLLAPLRAWFLLSALFFPSGEAASETSDELSMSQPVPQETEQMSPAPLPSSLNRPSKYMVQELLSGDECRQQPNDVEEALSVMEYLESPIYMGKTIR